GRNGVLEWWSNGVMAVGPVRSGPSREGTLKIVSCRLTRLEPPVVVRLPLLGLGRVVREDRHPGARLLHGRRVGQAVPDAAKGQAQVLGVRIVGEAAAGVGWNAE